MRFLEYYLGQNIEKHVLYFLGNTDDFSSLHNTVNMCSFDDFYLVVEDENFSSRNTEFFDSLPKKTKVLHVAELSKISEKVREFCVIFDSYTNFDSCISMLNSHPKKIVGCFEKEVSTFEVWERLKKYSDSVVLASKVCKEKCDVLKWKKQDGDVELSIILPVYNVEKYLRKCLDSLIEWKAPYVEFVFVNDGSPDNSKEVIKEYQNKDQRIKLLNKENGGCASAREYGLLHSKGRYVGFVDPDDFVDPTMFKKLLSKALKGGYDIAYSRYFEYYEDTGLTKSIDDLSSEVYTFGTSDLKSIDLLIANLRVAIWRCIYKREFLVRENIHFYEDLKRFDDLPFKVETFARANSVVCVDEPLYYYRLGREGQDVSVHDKRLFVHFEIFEHLDKFFESVRRSEQRTLYYQVKVQTHYWGLINLDKEFVPEYLENASKDLTIENNSKSWEKVVSKYYKKEETKLFMRRVFSK